MPTFGDTSRANLEQCDERLQRLFEKVVDHFDCMVVDGHRTCKEQTDVYASGRSHVPWPLSKHNELPALAADVAPWDKELKQIPWSDIDRFYAFGWYVKGVADGMGIPIRWGGDWDDDTDTEDQTFNDLGHFELSSGGRNTA